MNGKCSLPIRIKFCELYSRRNLINCYVKSSMNYYLHPNRTKENCSGPFYTVDIGCDCGCGLPEEFAPSLLQNTNDRRRQTYFFKQPESQAEVELAINVVNLCPIHDIRYGGKDPEIIAQISAGKSDYEVNAQGVAVLNQQHT